MQRVLFKMLITTRDSVKLLMAIPVTKASGKMEEFDIGKLVDSLVRSGAPEDIARDIADKVSIQVTHSILTRHIFRMAKKLLKQYSRATGMRYSLSKRLFMPSDPQDIPSKSMSPESLNHMVMALR